MVPFELPGSFECPLCDLTIYAFRDPELEGIWYRCGGEEVEHLFQFQPRKGWFREKEEGVYVLQDDRLVRVSSKGSSDEEDSQTRQKQCKNCKGECTDGDGLSAPECAA
jgi:hypothetical protein